MYVYRTMYECMRTQLSKKMKKPRTKGQIEPIN